MKKRLTAMAVATIIVGALVLVYGIFREPVVAGTPPAQVSTAEMTRLAAPSPMQGSQPKDKAAVPAPDFTLADLDGKQVALSGFRGKKVVIIDFWATWCGPCRMTMPALHSYAQKNKKTVEVLSIDQQEDPRRVAEFINAQSYSGLHVLLDRDGAVSQAYRVYGIPTLFVIDKQGLLRHKFMGYRPDLEQYIAQVISQL
jgi:thiol-disulfide isomerase/thioredoxin